MPDLIPDLDQPIYLKKLIFEYNLQSICEIALIWYSQPHYFSSKQLQQNLVHTEFLSEFSDRELARRLRNWGKKKKQR